MKRKGSVLIFTGLLLIAAALFITAFNLREEAAARTASVRAADRLEALIPAHTPRPAAVPGAVLPENVPETDMEMPVKTVDGVDYIGVIAVPSLSLELPVASEWSYERLKISPCRYSGSVYSGDMVLCAHNYSSHFGQIKTLKPGDAVVFTDVDGNVYNYEVAELETLQPAAVDEMKSGEWDLTLFTCTIGGQTRVTVRCDRV